MFYSTFNLQSLWPVATLLTIAVIIPIILDIFKLKFIPSLAVEIIVGLGLGFIPDTREFFLDESGELSSINEGIYVLGMSILLFLSGLDTNFGVFKKTKKGENMVINELVLSIICFAFVLLLSFGASFIFYDYIPGRKMLGITLLTIFFSSTFASLVIPLVHDYDIEHTTIGRIVSTYSTIAELFSILALSILIALETNGNKWWLILVVFGLLALIIIIKRFIPIEKIFNDKLEGITHLSTRVTILGLLLFVILSDLAGAEYILGAFLLGMVFSLLGTSKNLVSKVNSIGYGIFVPMFYMLAGYKVALTINEIGYSDFFTLSNLGLFALIFAIMLLVKMPFMVLAKYYPIKTYLPSIFIITSTIIVALSIEHISGEYDIFTHNLVACLVFASLITCVIPPILFANNKDFGEAREKYKPVILEKSDVMNLQHHD